MMLAPEMQFTSPLEPNNSYNPARFNRNTSSDKQFVED
jgi:hypothetical protein